MTAARILLVDVGAISAELARALRARGYVVSEVAIREVGSWLAGPALLVLGPGAAREATREALSPYLSEDRPLVVLAEDGGAVDRLRFVVSGPVVHVQPRGQPGPIADRVLEAVAAHLLARENAMSQRAPALAGADLAAPPAPPVKLPAATGEPIALGAPSPRAPTRRGGAALLAAGGSLLILGASAAVAAFLITHAAPPPPPVNLGRVPRLTDEPEAPRAAAPARPEEAVPEAPSAPAARMPEETIAEARRNGGAVDALESDALVRRAGRELDAGDVARAEATLREALERDPDNPRAWAHMGRLHLAKGDPDAAIAWLELAIERRFPRAQYHVWLGDARLAAGDRRGARAAWESALRREPENAEALSRLGRAR